jgi:hypothetical protein
MYQQSHDLLLQRATPFLRLTKGGWNRDYDVSQQLSGDRRDRRSRFSQRKGKHVGAAILPTEAVIESPHLPIPYKRQSEIGGRFPDHVQYRLRESQDASTAKPYGSDLNLEGNGH